MPQSSSEGKPPEPARPPPPAAQGLRAMLVLRPGKRRWPTGVRAALCIGVPALVGWLAGDMTAGLTATLGGFTALYGSGRPYLNRAVLLAVIALALSVSVGLGIWAASITWVGVLTVTLIATVATLLCNALDVGPPGAYQFALVCAVGTGLHAHHEKPAIVALFVLAGGAFAWLVHLSGALFRPHGPERSAVAAAGAAVADYLDVLGTDGQEEARHRADQAMQDAWTALIDRQPARLAPGRTVRWLRGESRHLQMLFADVVTSPGAHTSPDPDAANVARAIAHRARASSGSGEAAPAGRLPLSRPGVLDLLRRDLQPHSRSLLVVTRVAVATALAGAAGGLLGLDHAYWTMSTAVLILHQGLPRRRTVQRGLERFVGTWLGLGLTTVIVLLQPHALWFIVTIMILDFLIQLTVVRNYALAVIFITALALLITTGGRSDVDIGALLLGRGLDTAVGCAIALAVFLLMVPPRVSAQPPEAIAGTIDGVAATAAYLSAAAIATPEARAARGDLRRRVLHLTQTFDVAINGSADQRKAVERIWPAMVATRQLAYRALAECWRLERAADEGDSEDRPVPQVTELRRTLGALAAAVRAGDRPPSMDMTSCLFPDEVRNLYDALVRDPD